MNEITRPIEDPDDISVLMQYASFSVESQLRIKRVVCPDHGEGAGFDMKGVVGDSGNMKMSASATSCCDLGIDTFLEACRKEMAEWPGTIE